MTATSNLT